jgi:hypothetical protein
MQGHLHIIIITAQFVVNEYQQQPVLPMPMMG